MKFKVEIALICAIVFVSPGCVKSADESSNDYRREFIVNMTKEAWNAYVTKAWGKRALGERSSGHSHTILESLTTLRVMNLDDEFTKAKQWVEKNLTFAPCIDKNLIEECISSEDQASLGSLLSAYALTNDSMFIRKAAQMYDATYAGTVQLEMLKDPRIIKLDPILVRVLFISFGATYNEARYLTALTGNATFYSRLETIEQITRKALGNITKIINEEQKHVLHYLLWLNGYKTRVNSFYQQNGKDVKLLLRLYREVEVMQMANFFGYIPRFGTTIMMSSTRGFFQNSPDLVSRIVNECHFGATLALAGQAMLFAKSNSSSWRSLDMNESNLELLRNISTYWDWARGVVEMCQLTIDSPFNKAGLPPESYYLKPNVLQKDKLVTEISSSYYSGYNLNPDLVESYFILWRLTKDQKYREWAWQFAQALYKHARTKNGEYGYWSVATVTSSATDEDLDSPQLPIFISATLKYLFLIFSNDTVLPLDKWVFNAMGHPLPICERNYAYPTCN